MVVLYRLAARANSLAMVVSVEINQADKVQHGCCLSDAKITNSSAVGLSSVQTNTACLPLYCLPHCCLVLPNYQVPPFASFDRKRAVGGTTACGKVCLHGSIVYTFHTSFSEIHCTAPKPLLCTLTLM